MGGGTTAAYVCISRWIANSVLRELDITPPESPVRSPGVIVPTNASPETIAKWNTLLTPEERQVELPRLQRIVGRAQWCFATTRLEIGTTLNQLSREIHRPTQGTVAAARRLILYLYSNPDDGIEYSRQATTQAELYVMQVLCRRVLMAPHLELDIVHDSSL